MKTNFIRILTIMTLASGISAFALSEKPHKNENTQARNAPCEATPARSGAQPVDSQPANSTQKARQELIEEQEKQWLYDTRNNDAG